MIAPWNDSLEPMDDDRLMPESDELIDLADDLGWTPDQETSFEETD